MLNYLLDELISWLNTRSIDYRATTYTMPEVRLEYTGSQQVCVYLLFPILVYGKNHNTERSIISEVFPEGR